MSTSIKGKQTWLTRQRTQLDDSMKRFEELLETASQLSPREMLIQTRQGSMELEFRKTALEKALEQFTSAADAADLTGEN
ncbi:hypothetical protein GCK32_011869 [Trichostrongylus colubriformis]|uniref:Uncharacterized protein n=1 Tax=Trichostrongylus colubriformis TaxID=6319 RepID=A0AAN8INT6_TRICO